MNMGTELPDCPKCHADGPKHVEIVQIVIPRKGPERDDFLCRCCAHPWSVLRPQLPDARPLA
jgi:hypothetical protein